MWGQKGLSVEQIGGAGVVPVDDTINHRVSGAAETYEISRSSGRYLVVRAEAGVFRYRPGLQNRRTFTVASQVLDTLTCTGHGYETGDGPLRLSNSGGALPTGLAIDTDYWVVVVDANTIQLALSRSDAMRVAFSGDQSVVEEGRVADPIVVDITGNGTGTQEIGGFQGAGEQVGFDDPVATPTATETGSGSWPLLAGETILVTGRGITVRATGAGCVLTWTEIP